MDCNDARPLLSAHVDRELSAAEALRVEQHLATCVECRREAQALQAVSQLTRTAPYSRAPHALRERIVAALPAVEPVSDEEITATVAEQTPMQTRTRERPSRRASKPTRPWHMGAGAGTVPRRNAMLGWSIGVAVVALAVSTAIFVTRPASTNAVFVDELVASHVRAELSGRDIDVVSSDRHTVKPWFNGRLDYAPPVEDLADAGFALTGGRLDYIGHRRVGVLVYRYRKHMIDVYVMPETHAGAHDAPTALTSDGFALASWRRQGMRWWAISDAEPAVLAQFRAALAARLNGTPPGPPK